MRPVDTDRITTRIKKELLQRNGVVDTVSKAEASRLRVVSKMKVGASSCASTRERKHVPTAA
jgi:hypothetical protein